MPRGIPHADQEWLDLVAGVLSVPLSGWPEELVVKQLRQTFDLVTCSYNDVPPSGSPVHRIWPLEDSLNGHRRDIEAWAATRALQEHPLLIFYGATQQRVPMQSADVPERWVGPQQRAAWDGIGRLADSRYQLALPLQLSASGRRAFVLRRATPFSPAEMDLATRIWRLLTGIDRQIMALTRARPVLAHNLSEMVAMAEPAATGRTEPVGRLTARELAVLRLLASGPTAAAIARQLMIAERTVHTHLAHIYRKLAVDNRLSAVLRAQELGLLRLDIVPTGARRPPTHQPLDQPRRSVQLEIGGE